MDALPTPYDIANVPSSPFAPSLLAWSMLFTIALLGFALVYLRRLQLPFKSTALREHALKNIRELKTSLATEDISQLTTAASFTLKRFIHASFNLDLDASSAEDIRQIKSPSIQVEQLIAIIVQLESQKFAPTQSLDQVKSLLTQAESLL